MSSDGSVMSSISRIRQFGLYRSIDARTEEFLRASRKRQIRQGCACAAVSTAITVTVVVSVILVYEYSINSDSNSHKIFTLKPNWIGLMNENNDVTFLDSKFTKKMNFDKTTMKLLPILIKALNKNRYLEKILDDYSTSPTYDRKETTEYTFKKGVFNKINWVKMPTFRLSSVEYKSSPSLLKIPINSLEYFRKTKKTRDYKRMLNYFDKMVSDRVGSSQQIVKRQYASTEKALFEYAMTSPMTTPKYETINQKIPIDRNNSEHDRSCKCPKNLGHLINKLISRLRELIPNIVADKNTACENKTGQTSDNFKEPYTRHRQKYLLLNPFIKTSTEFNDEKISQAKTIAKNGIHQKFKVDSSENYKMIHNANKYKSLNEMYFPSVVAPNVMRPNYNRYFNYAPTKPTATQKTHRAVPTNSPLLQMTPATTENIRHLLIVGKNTANPMKAPITEDYEYENNIFTTPIPVEGSSIDIIALKVPQTKRHKEIYNDFKWSAFRKLGQPSNYYNPYTTMDSQGDGIADTAATYLPTANNKKLFKVFNIKPGATNTQNEDSSKYDVMNNTKFISPKDNDTATKVRITKFGLIVVDEPSNNHVESKNEHEINIDNTLTDVDLGKILPENGSQEKINTKHTDNAIEFPSKIENDSDISSLWDTIKDNRTPAKSMLPPIPQVYLEIQRNNEWKHEDHIDYESNYNNMFDVPNI